MGLISTPILPIFRTRRDGLHPPLRRARRVTVRSTQGSRDESARRKSPAKKVQSSSQEGLFKQVAKTLQLLATNPRHPSLQTNEYTTLPNPYDPKGKVFEAYTQNKTPGAYRVFWCYGPATGEITILAITPHP